MKALSTTTAEEGLAADYNNSHNSRWTVSPGELVAVVEAYTRRVGRDDDIKQLEGLPDIVETLESSIEYGIKSTSIDERRKVYRSNKIAQKKPTAFWRLVWNAAADFILRVLMLAGLLSLTLALVFGEDKKVEWIEGASIFLAVLIVVFVTAGNDYVKERQFAILFQQDARRISILRDGCWSEHPVVDLVVGDVVYIEAGGEVPADCLVLTSNDLLADESAVTGESHTCRKGSLQECIEERKRKENDTCARSGEEHKILKSPVCLSGSNIIGGSGTLIVVAVGPYSQSGKVISKMQTPGGGAEPQATPLQNKLNALATDIGNAGLIAAVLTLLILIITYWATFKSVEDKAFKSVLQTHLRFLVEAITIVVVAVPEGLPLAVTLSLAFSVGKMLKERNYVRRLAACETMGGASEICSDKTGTLTLNRMSVAFFWSGSKVYPILGSTKLVAGQPDSASGDNDAPTASTEHNETSQITYANNEVIDILGEAISLNSTAYIDSAPPPGAVAIDMGSEPSKFVGSPTECALLEFYENALNGNYWEIRNKRSKAVKKRFEFTSERKMMTTVVEHPTEEGKLRVYVKGAAEIVLPLCVWRYGSSGEWKSLEVGHVDKLQRQVIEGFTSRGLRSICIAFRDLDPNEMPDWSELKPPVSMSNCTQLGHYRRRRSSLTVPLSPSATREIGPLMGREFHGAERDLICLGIAGIRDPVRPEVPAAVLRCQDAGIRVRMVTGDNIETAKQVALICNIYKPERGGIALTGAEFLERIGGIVCKSCRTVECPCNVVPPSDEDESSDDGSTDKKKANKCCSSTKPSNLLKRKKKTELLREDVVGNMDAFKELAPKLEVMGRSQPTDKYALVLGLKAMGAVVAVTGDGTNDAPALRAADVGLAMGKTGKETAKQAADIVLLDDNFESIVRAVLWGRNIFDCIRRFLQFQLTVNVAAVITAFVSALILRQSPLSAVQMLWVNLIMDTLASLALATEKPHESLLDRKPHKRDEYLVNRTMARNILGQAVYQLSVLMIQVFTGERWIPERRSGYSDRGVLYPGFSEFSVYGNFVTPGRAYRPFSSQEVYKKLWAREIGPSRHYTVVFNTFVLMQVFNLLNARKLRGELNVFAGCLKNPLWLGITIGILVCQVLLVQFGRYALNCHLEGLTIEQWAICFAFGAGSLVVHALLRFVPADLAPELGKNESDLLQPQRRNVALASRGRFSTGRLSSRLLLAAAAGSKSTNLYHHHIHHIRIPTDG